MTPKTFWSTFQESDGTWSWSRIASSFTVATSIFCLVHLVLKNHQLPDGMAIAALGAFGTFPYGANKVTGVFQKQS